MQLGSATVGRRARQGSPVTSAMRKEAGTMTAKKEMDRVWDVGRDSRRPIDQYLQRRAILLLQSRLQRAV